MLVTGDASDFLWQTQQLARDFHLCSGNTQSFLLNCEAVLIKQRIQGGLLKLINVCNQWVQHLGKRELWFGNL